MALRVPGHPKKACHIHRSYEAIASRMIVGTLHKQSLGRFEVVENMHFVVVENKVGNMHFVVIEGKEVVGTANLGDNWEH